MSLKLISWHSKIPEKIKDLYESAFPAEERRAWQKQMTLFEQHKLKLSEIMLDNVFAGFVFYWQLKETVFIEHFAIDTSIRGNGIGSSVMNLFAQEFKSIILEAEPEEKGTDAVRRISFYEKLGYAKFTFSYAQPSYTSENVFLKMHLMHKNTKNDLLFFETVRKELYTKVYNTES